MAAAAWAAALAAMLVGCAPPVEESLRIEFLRDHEPHGAMEIRAEVKLNRDAGDKDDEALQNRIDEVAAELADGTGFWHERFDRLRGPASDGIDLTKQKGEISRFERWAVMTDPGPALLDFFADTQMVADYKVTRSSENGPGETSTPQTVTLTFRPAGESLTTGDDLAHARSELLKVANAIVRFQGTVGELWTYLEENPAKRRAWIGVLAFGDEEAMDELDRDLSDYEEDLWTRLLDDLFSALWPDLGLSDGDTFVLYEELQQVFDAFPANLTVKPDGEVVEAVGFREAKGAFVFSVGDISWAVVDVLEETVSPSFVGFWASEGLFGGSPSAGAEDGDCDRACQLEETLALPFAVRPAEAREIAAALENALTPLGEYRLRWIRDPP